MKYKVGDRVYLYGIKYIVTDVFPSKIEPLDKVMMENEDEAIEFYSDDPEIKKIITCK
jgi:hypothetical protein